jgi:hypothetical protein
MSEAAAAPVEATPTPADTSAEPSEAPELEAAPVAEGEPSEAEAPPAEPAPPADPPRLAAAKKLAAAAAKKEAEAAEAKKALESERQAFQAEVERVKATIGQAWPAFELGRDLVALKGQPAGKVLARLRAAGLELDARSLAAAVLDPSEGDEDDRPLTMKQLRALQEQERKDRERKEAEERQKAEQAATQTRAQQEQAFLGHVASEGRSPSAARLIEALDDAGRTAVLKDAWGAVASFKASGRAYTTHDLLDAVEASAKKRLAALGLAPAVPAPAAPAAPVPQALTNKTSGGKPPSSRPLTKEERWEQAFRELS